MDRMRGGRGDEVNYQSTSICGSGSESSSSIVTMLTSTT